MLRRRPAVQGKGGVGVCVGLDALSRQLDMGQGAAKAGTPLPRGELVGEAKGRAGEEAGYMLL